MLKTVCIVFILVLSACMEKKAPEKDNSRSEISKILYLQAAEWNRGSIDGFMKAYWHSDSTRFMGKSGLHTGYDSICNRYKRHYNSKEKMGQLLFNRLEFFSMNSDPSFINVTGKWSLQNNTMDSGRFSLFFKKLGGEWKIIIDNTW